MVPRLAIFLFSPDNYILFSSVSAVGIAEAAFTQASLRVYDSAL